MSENALNICNMFCSNLGPVFNVRNIHLMICGMYDLGWMQDLQEKATEWDDWDELVDRGWFLFYQNGRCLICAYMICFEFPCFLLSMFFFIVDQLLCFPGSKALFVQDLAVIHLMAMHLHITSLSLCF